MSRREFTEQSSSDPTRPRDTMARPSPSAGSSSHVNWGSDLARNHSHTSSHSHLEADNQDGTEHPRRRNSSIAVALNAISNAGGVNSIDNFARSWQRAAGFYEIMPVRSSFRIALEDEEQPAYSRKDIDHSPEQSRSLLRQAFEAEGRRISEDAITDEPIAADAEHEVISLAATDVVSRRDSKGESILDVEPSLASPYGGSYGTYGSLSTRVNDGPMRHAAHLFNEQQLKGTSDPDGEREPLLVKRVEEDGVTYNVVVGQSTLPQTVFNSVNVLVGVGLLSLPLGFKYAGWVIGLTFFTFCVAATRYTAKLLAKCLDVDKSLITFADLAYVSFGSKARVAMSLLFSVELIGANVALIMLFGDSLDALVPGYSKIAWKAVCCVILIPLGFLPLRLLSFTSVLGILCCFGIVAAVFIDGLIKQQAPGSLREPARTYMFPENWGTLPLAFGLIISPWGGHSVFPNIYKDMRHPHKYEKGLNITYSISFIVDLGMAVTGLLMFGDETRDEITSNILLTDGYPHMISVMMVVFIAIIPVTKVPLNSRPIVSTLEVLLGLDSRVMAQNPSLSGMSGWNRGLLKVAVRVGTTVVIVVVAMIFPSFDRIMALLGAVCCFTVCIIMPLAFHLKLFGKELSRGEYILNWILMVVSGMLALVSTVFACLPKEMLIAM